MFSRKFQKELYQNKYNSMKQLDRIEFQNRELIFNNNQSSGDSYYILSFISIFFSISFITNYIYLASLGVISTIHLSMGRISAMIGLYFMAFYFIILLINTALKSRHKTNQEKFLEEHSK